MDPQITCIGASEGRVTPFVTRSLREELRLLLKGRYPCALPGTLSGPVEFVKAETANKLTRLLPEPIPTRKGLSRPCDLAAVLALRMLAARPEAQDPEAGAPTKAAGLSLREGAKDQRAGQPRPTNSCSGCWQLAAKGEL